MKGSSEKENSSRRQLNPNPAMHALSQNLPTRNRCYKPCRWRLQRAAGEDLAPSSAKLFARTTRAACSVGCCPRPTTGDGATDIVRTGGSSRKARSSSPSSTLLAHRRLVGQEPLRCHDAVDVQLAHVHEALKPRRELHEAPERLDRNDLTAPERGTSTIGVGDENHKNTHTPSRKNWKYSTSISPLVLCETC